MITEALISPKSIVIVGASNDTSKPGGKVLRNILDHNYSGQLFGVNPKESNVQGVHCFHTCSELPEVDLAIIAISATHVEETVRILAYEKKCKAYIIFSSGFGEIGAEGKALEKRCVDIVESVGGTLIGPNCIGVLTPAYKGVFAGPIPKFSPQGCDCVSASGATLVFILEQAIPRGLTFSSLFSVGNSAQVGVEEILEYWDQNFDPEKSSRIKLLYMEEVSNPEKFLRHALSLVRKGCRIAAIKAGTTEAGSRAVSSHTGSLAGSDTAVGALFRKAGIVRCYSRVELVYVAAIFAHQQLKGNRLAVITHAGGPGVMLTDILIKGGMKVPKLEGPAAQSLLGKLHHGSSVSNPIDFLATGTAEQLGAILDTVENDFDEIDGSVVVFGTTGMWSVNNVYEVLHEKMKTCKKPIFPILPSVIQAADEVSLFQSKGGVNFTDEVSFGYVLSRVYRTHEAFPEAKLPEVDLSTIRSVIDSADKGYLHAGECVRLLKAVGLEQAPQYFARNAEELQDAANLLGFPLAMKVSGPLHKTDVGGVKLSIRTHEEALMSFDKLMLIQGADGVIIQPMLSGQELFLGARKEDKFGHIILCGLGGIFVEIFRDISSGLSPISRDEAYAMIQRLRSYPLIKGARGKAGVNENIFAESILRLSALLEAAPEIVELDINPLLGTMDYLKAVDVRIAIEK
ncbi:MAG: acetate--CoA ligase family protein [Bacteroidetes bacterium]|nr:acetate--CoA ligase family protein [Bacteroidota bacterium]